MEMSEAQSSKAKALRATALIFGLCSLILFAPAQKKYKKQVIGLLEQEIFHSDKQLKKWFVKGYKNYHPDTAVLSRLKQHLADKKIVVVLGTWCSDSQREFPHLMKVLDANDFPKQNLVIYGIDKEKTVPPDIISRYKITHVPTIILMNKDGSERGTIVEVVKETIEKDLLNL
jgi:thiol-disulfide isomerase/thioredoxin